MIPVSYSSSWKTEAVRQGEIEDEKVAGRQLDLTGTKKHPANRAGFVDSVVDRIGSVLVESTDFGDGGVRTMTGHRTDFGSFRRAVVARYCA